MAHFEKLSFCSGGIKIIYQKNLTATLTYTFAVMVNSLPVQAKISKKDQNSFCKSIQIRAKSWKSNIFLIFKKEANQGKNNFFIK